MTDLVVIEDIIPDIQLDIRYATANNFTGQVLYPCPSALLVLEAAIDLAKVQTDLRDRGLGLLVWDAYRPLSVTKTMWDTGLITDDKLVANPATGSIHNRGCAVDVTLWDFIKAAEVLMPTGFDSFTELANTQSLEGDLKQRQARDLLIATMAEYNFTVGEKEWWHFNWLGWENYLILDESLRSESAMLQA